jgi:hypothetical protein
LEQDGFLQLGASSLKQSDVAQLRELLAAAKTEGPQQPLFSQATPTLQEEAVVQRTLASPTILPKVVDALGWNICLSSAFAAAPASTGPAPVIWGRSDGQLPQEVATTGVDLPCLGIFAVCSLQAPDDTSEAPAVWLLPGSHHVPVGEEAAAVAKAQGGAGYRLSIPLGGAVLLDRRLIHGREACGSRGSRLAVAGGGSPVLSLLYGYRWLRSPDPFYVEGAMAGVRCPITRQLLGYCTANYARYAPTGDDAPLRCWLHDNGMTEDVGKMIPSSGGKRRPVTGYDAPPMPWGSRAVEFRGGLEGDVGYTTHSRQPYTAELEARLHGP